MNTNIDHYNFTKNTGGVLFTWNAKTITFAHSEFVDNTVAIPVGSLNYLFGDKISVSLNEFINNRVNEAE